MENNSSRVHREERDLCAEFSGPGVDRGGGEAVCGGGFLV